MDERSVKLRQAEHSLFRAARQHSVAPDNADLRLLLRAAAINYAVARLSEVNP